MLKGNSIKINEHISWRKIAGKMVLLNKKTNDRYILNEIGKILWEHITSEQQLNGLTDIIAEQYSIHKDRVGCDIDGFIKNLEHENILSVEVIE